MHTFNEMDISKRKKERKCICIAHFMYYAYLCSSVTAELEPPIPAVFPNTGISVLEELKNTGINTGIRLVLLRWQEFASRSAAVFFTCHRGGGAGGEYRSCQG